MLNNYDNHTAHPLTYGPPPHHHHPGAPVFSSSHFYPAAPYYHHTPYAAPGIHGDPRYGPPASEHRRHGEDTTTNNSSHEQSSSSPHDQPYSYTDYSPQSMQDHNVPSHAHHPHAHRHYQPQGSPPPLDTVYPNTGSELVYELRDEDVLCGRGAPTNWHPGNQFFRQLVSKYQSSYLASRRADKPEIAMKVVQIINNRGGRFLKRTKMPGRGPSGHFCWRNIGEQRSYEKACQALRENAPEIRRRLAAQELASVSSESFVSQDPSVIGMSRNKGMGKENEFHHKIEG